MTTNHDSKVFSLLQPDLLTVEDLVQKIQSRCCKIRNLELMSKEELVGLFRRVILPLPQRFYRTNRRGKMLSSFRAKAGLETKRKDEGCSYELSRLKPPPCESDAYKDRISATYNKRNRSLDNIIIKDRIKLNRCDRGEDEGRNNSKISRSSSSSCGKIISLKRSHSTKNENPTQCEHPTENKKQRTAIKWP